MNHELKTRIAVEAAMTCPFCGSSRIGTHFKKSNRRSGYQSMCLECRVGQTHTVYDSMQASVGAWNIRSCLPEGEKV